MSKLKTVGLYIVFIAMINFVVYMSLMELAR